MRSRHRQSSRTLGLALVLIGAGASLVGRASPAAAADAAPAKAAGKTKVSHGKSGKKKLKKAADDAAAVPEASKRRRVTASPAYLVGDSDAHLINESAPRVTAFPHEAKAVEKAFAENRREQLLDAELAARAAKSPDRWRTVLFMLHGLNDNGDPEACFWRVLSFYRLGELDRARAVRAVCDLPAKDSSTLNAEDALVAGVPAMGTVARQDQWTQPTNAAAVDAAVPPPPPPATPYSGPGPQRYKD